MLENALEGKKFLVNDTFSAADIAVSISDHRRSSKYLQTSSIASSGGHRICKCRMGITGIDDRLLGACASTEITTCILTGCTMPVRNVN